MYTQERLALPSSAPCSGSGQNRRPSERYQAVERSATIRVAPAIVANRRFRPNGFVFSSADSKAKLLAARALVCMRNPGSTQTASFFQRRIRPRGSIPALRKTPNKSPRVPRSATGASNRRGKVEKFVRGARCGFPCGPRGDRCQARPCISTARGFRFCAAGLTARGAAVWHWREAT
jgi:hypothetical protein